MSTTAIVTTQATQISTSSATLGNVGEYTMIAASTDDQRLSELWINRPNRSVHTKAQYERAWRQFCEAVPVPLQAVTYEHLQQWAEQLTGSEHTRKVKISAMRSLFSFAQRVGYLRVNPAVMVDPPKARDTKHVRILTESDVHAMLAVTKCRRDKVLLRVLYSSGARISELLALTWQDVVPVDGGKAVLMIHGKGGKSREAGVSAATYAELLKLRDSRAGADPVFVSNRGNALDRTVVNRIVSRAAEAAGIAGNVSPHWLRHSHVSHALERGANPEAVRQQVGHASLATTTGYAHSSSSSADYLTI